MNGALSRIYDNLFLSSKLILLASGFRLPFLRIPFTLILAIFYHHNYAKILNKLKKSTYNWEKEQMLFINVISNYPNAIV